MRCLGESRIKPGRDNKTEKSGYCVDDLKAFYYEARMVQKPGTPSEELHPWFWGETALGQLLPAVGQRLNGADDPAWKAVAFGISR